MFANFNPGALGIRAGMVESLALAMSGGWAGMDLPVAEALDLGVAATSAAFSKHAITPGGWGLPLDWRAPYDSAALANLGRQAELAAALGCTRAYTWVMPCSDELPFRENFAYHVSQLQPVAGVLAEHGCRLGLEFIGPLSTRQSKRYGFVSTIDGMLSLAQAVGPNVGLLMDCWHWHARLGAISEIRGLRADDVVFVHINDVPSGADIATMPDTVRALPLATGTIDIGGFLGALAAIGYDGPVTPEPFDVSLAALPAADVSAQAAQATRAAIAAGRA